MDITKQFLRIAVAFSLVTCAISLLIYTVKYNPARAQMPSASGVYVPIGIIQHDLQRDGTPGYLMHVIGFNPNAADDKIKVLAKEWVKR